MYIINTMIRTQIYLPEEIHSQLSKLAQAKDKSMAALIRKFVKTGLKKTQEKDFSGKNNLIALSKLNLKDGPKDLSSRLDYYLYGEPENEK